MKLHLVVGARAHEVALEPGEEGHVRVTVDGEPFDVALELDGPNATCTVDGRAIEVERRGRALFVDGERVDVGVRGLAQAGIGPGAGGGGQITPPMPGRIVEVLVAEGDEVEAGQPLLVLEAMKMQNEITAPGKARVAQLNVAVGDAVEAKDVLVVLEPAG